MATYLAGKNTTVTINATVRGFTDGSYTTGTETDDMTNTAEGSFGRDIGTVKRATINGTIAFNADAPLDFDEDEEVAVVITNTSGPGLSGTFLVVSMSNPSISPRSGVKIGVEMRSQGVYTKTGGA
jgi:hypothetical protein